MGFGPLPGAPDSSVVLVDGPWTHRTVRANGIALHVAEVGSGPLVLLIHGFPQFWWAWRQQMTDLADAGLRRLHHSDRTTALESLVTGIRVVRNETAQGFVMACNAGGAVARGDHIVLLNNDTEVSPNWIDRLLDPFDLYENVGMTGAKLLYADGRLQEAGGVVWRDGGAWGARLIRGTISCARPIIARVHASWSRETCGTNSAVSTWNSRRPITKTPIWRSGSARGA